MKKILAKFSESLLSKEHMKKVKGGYGSGCCTAYCFDREYNFLGAWDVSGCNVAGLACRGQYGGEAIANCSCG